MFSNASYISERTFAPKTKWLTYHMYEAMIVEQVLKFSTGRIEHKLQKIHQIPRIVHITVDVLLYQMVFEKVTKNFFTL